MDFTSNPTGTGSAPKDSVMLMHRLPAVLVLVVSSVTALMVLPPEEVGRFHNECGCNVGDEEIQAAKAVHRPSRDSPHLHSTFGEFLSGTR